jgi:hypothetical protein
MSGDDFVPINNPAVSAALIENAGRRRSLATRHAFGSALYAAVASIFILLAPARVLAHCDGLDGPVVKAAQRALDTRNPALVLIWVRSQDEREIREAFDRTLAVRDLSSQARELADRFFFETVVRVHRAGEGEPFTGLQPAGRDLGPAIPAADTAIETESVEPLLKVLVGSVEERVREQFRDAIATKPFETGDVTAGRAHVAAYVKFVHLAERVYGATRPVEHDHAGSGTTRHESPRH